MHGKNQIQILTGRKGTGKTTLACQLARQSQRRLVVAIDPMADLGPGMLQIRSFQEFLAWFRWDDVRGRIVFVPTDQDQVEIILSRVRHTSDVCLLIDEPTFFPDLLDDLDLRDIAARGRHRGQDVIIISHRLVDLTPIWRQQADDIHFFQTIDAASIDHAAKIIGREQAKKLPYLQVGEKISLSQCKVLVEKKAVDGDDDTDDTPIND